jgi:hypothetical protein
MAQRADFNDKAAKTIVKPLDSTTQKLNSKAKTAVDSLVYKSCNICATQKLHIPSQHKAPAIMAGALFDTKMGSGLQVGNDVREHVTNRSAEQGHNNDDHDGYQNKNQRIFYEPLPFFILKVHSIYLLSVQFSVRVARRFTKYRYWLGTAQ